jgi:hypothetical protein
VTAQNGPGHAFALRNEDGVLSWLETQGRPGRRVRPVAEGPPVAGGDVRVIVADATGRAVRRETLSAAPTVADSLRLARDDSRYGALGSELEAHGFLLHVDGYTDVDRAFPDGDETILRNEATGIELYTDTGDRWVAGGRYFSSKRSAERSGRGRPEYVPVKVVEIIADPARVLAAGEDNRHDLQVVLDGIEDVLDRLGRAVTLRNGQAGPGYRGTPLRQLFEDDGDYRFQEIADRLTVVRPPGSDDLLYVQITVGLPLVSLPYVLWPTARAVRSPYMASYWRAGVRFGHQMTRAYLEERLGTRVGRFAVPAVAYVPGAAELHAYATEMFTHTAAAARREAVGDGLAKNHVHGALREWFAGVRESLPPGVRDFLSRNHDQNRRLLERALEDRLGTEFHAYDRRRRAAGRPPRDLADYPLSEETKTLGDYIDNMLLPRDRLRVLVTQDEAINIRTDYPEPDDNERRLDPSLHRVEIRDVGGPTDLPFGTAKAKIRRFARLAAEAYELAQGVRRNGSTADGRRYVEALLAATREISDESAPAHRLVTEVRELLDAVAREAPEAVSVPVRRGDVTTNAQADAVIALGGFLRRPNGATARAVRRAIEAIGQAVTDYRGMRSGQGGHAAMARIRRQVNALISDLRRYEDRHRT